MPTDRASFIATAITAARARCQSKDGAPMPVENQISSQHPGLVAISLKFYHIRRDGVIAPYRKRHDG